MFKVGGASLLAPHRCTSIFWLTFGPTRNFFWSTYRHVRGQILYELDEAVVFRLHSDLGSSLRWGDFSDFSRGPSLFLKPCRDVPRRRRNLEGTSLGRFRLPGKLYVWVPHPGFSGEQVNLNEGPVTCFKKAQVGVPQPDSASRI